MSATPAITYGSLCSGYDGIGQGLILAGLELAPLWMAETEPAMKRVLKREHDGVPDLDDIKTADFATVGRVRLMSSGDPCQSISIAGRQAGRDDPRFLWPWVRDAYRQVWPDVLFFENVANIVSHDGGRTMAERFEHLREDGYEVRWTVLGACAVGAPHHRHRWYAVAVRADGLAVPPAARRMGGKVAICGAPRRGGRQVLPTPNARDGGQRGTPTPEHARRRAADPMRSLNLEDAVSAYLLRPSLDSVSALLDEGKWGKYAAAIALWERVTGIPAPEPTEPNSKGDGRRLNPALPEWMMGLRPGLLTGELSRNEALKGAGNGVVPQAVAAAWQILMEGEQL